ncbi:MAG: hypothetical protein J6U04_05970, partial [Salinivirgaceae bacterium]|nr:hypothetical protein [Salinivirgaceae bacterium]
MKHLLRLSLAFSLAAAFVCCDDNSDPVPEPTPAPQPDTAKVEEAYNGVYVDGRYLKSPDGQILTLHGFAQTYSPWFNEQGTRWSNYDVEACLDYNQGLIDD